MKNLLLFSLFVFTVACSQNSMQNKEAITYLNAPVDYRSLGLFNGTDNFEYVSNDDSVSFKYGDIEISKMPNKEDVGEAIQVFKNGQYFNIGGDAAYFKGIINNLMIIEESTSSMSLVRIIDLLNMSEIFAESGMELRLIDKSLQFMQEVNIEDPAKRPVCPEELMEYPDQIGFAEMVFFDFSTRKLIRSGQFKCLYIE